MDLWMEVGTSSRPNKNRIYGLSNTTAENLRVARCVSTVGSTQSKEFVALQQHTTYLTENYKQLLVNYEQHMAHLTEKYEQFLVNYEQLRQMVMNMTS
jgi:hypothetical protein